MTTVYILILTTASLPVQSVIERTHDGASSAIVSYRNSRLELSEGTLPVIRKQQTLSDQESAAQPKGDQSRPAPQQSGQQAGQQSGQQVDPQDRRSFWERVFRLPPLRKRVEKALTEEWKFTDTKPRHIEYLLTEEGEDDRQFFLYSTNARQYQRLLKEYKCGFEDRNGKIVDDSFDTIRDYGPELIKNYPVLMENRELIKRYFAGVFRDGRIGSQALIRISNSMWFGPFETAKFKLAAHLLNSQYQVPNHVIGPMLASVGDSFWLRRVLSRRSSAQEFHQLLNRMAPPSSDGSGNAFAPALQLLVIGEEHKIPFKSLDSFIEQLKLRPQDLGPFSSIVYNLGAYKLASEIKCPTFAQFLRRQLD